MTTNMVILRPLLRSVLALPTSCSSIFRRSAMTTTATCCKFYQTRSMAPLSPPSTSTSTSTGSNYHVPWEYHYIEDVEVLEAYRPGGYHPIAIGDKLQGNRYRVLYKLGHGSYSTSWLVRDTCSQKLLTVKVGRAISDPREADVLADLTASPLTQDHALIESRGRALILPLLDRFMIYGPNGVHPCYVTPPGEADLSDVQETDSEGVFTLGVARALAAQLALAVGYLHSRGFVHGDLHLGNVLLRMSPSISRLSDEQLYDKYGQPESCPITRLDGKEHKQAKGTPSHVHLPVWFRSCTPASEQSLNLSDANIYLSDFGQSFQPFRETKYKSAAPVEVRPPESRFGLQPLSFSSDIWSLACGIWMIIGDMPLFTSFWPEGEEITCDQVRVLGVLPREWWQRWDARSKYFNDDGTPLQGHRESFEDRFQQRIQEARREGGREVLRPDERDALSAMLKAMLVYKPEDRITAAEVLNSEWMVKWAMPEYDKIRDVDT